jgi:hypothetical protein
MIKIVGRKLAKAGILLVSVAAIAIAPTVQVPPPPPVAAVRLAAATSIPIAAQPLVPQSNVLGALLRLDLGRFIIPPSAGQPFPTPPNIGPAPTQTGFEDAIINTYHAIEPWVRWGFELATYAVGWIPYVGWLSGQIMIFYNFGERIVESLVVNSANWLWGPLPFLTGLGNIARDSWNALVQLGIDQWNFWLPSLPPLPPFPFAANQTQAETLAAPSDQLVAPPNARPHPLRDALAALQHFLAGPDRVAPQDVDVKEEVDPQAVDPQQTVGVQEVRDEVGTRVKESALVDARGVAAPAIAEDGQQVQADLPRTDATPKLSRTSSSTRAPLTPLGTPKPFDRKSTPAAETSGSSNRPSNESVGVPNSPVGTSNDSVGTPHAPKNGSNGFNKHHVTGSPGGSTASSPDAA